MADLFNTNNIEDLREYILNYVGSAWNALPDCHKGRMLIGTMLGEIEDASYERLVEIAEMLGIM